MQTRDGRSLCTVCRDAPVFRLLVFLLIVLPCVETTLLLMLADATSWQVALAFVVVTGIAGAWLLKHQGLRTWSRIRQDLSAGQIPTDSLWDAGMLIAAGTLLLTPGVLTDLVGITLLFPPMRRLYRYWIVRWLRSRADVLRAGSFTEGKSEVIDSYIVKRHDN
jgi:UPF0716 family protein affecting phage T7 exclusion